MKRKRRQQENQKHPIRGIKTMKYLEVQYQIGSLTLFEQFLVVSIMNYLMNKRGIDVHCIRNHKSLVSVIFSESCKIAEAVKVQLPVFQRQEQELCTAVEHWILKHQQFARFM